MNRDIALTSFEKKIERTCSLDKNENIYIAIWGPINTVESELELVTGYQFVDYKKALAFYNTILESDKEISLSQYEVYICKAQTNTPWFMGYIKNYKVKESEIIVGLPKDLEGIKARFRY